MFQFLNNYIQICNIFYHINKYFKRKYFFFKNKINIYQLIKEFKLKF